jgi:hypothetical protein
LAGRQVFAYVVIENLLRGFVFQQIFSGCYEFEKKTKERKKEKKERKDLPYCCFSVTDSDTVILKASQCLKSQTFGMTSYQF